MPTIPDDLETLLLDVRKSIIENKQFLKNLMDETIEDDSNAEPETVSGEDDFEEL